MTFRPCSQCLLSARRAVSAPASSAPSTSSSARCANSARPVYVRHEIVHNRYVVEDLKAKGAIFVEELDEVPDGDAPVIFSAHGVPKSVPAEAERRNLFAIDATCPLVTKVHREAKCHHRARPRDHADRPRGPPGGRRHHGPAARRRRGPGARRAEDVAALDFADDAQPRLCHADHAVGGRHRATIVAALQARFPTSSARTRKTSATPPPTARRR